MNDMKVMSNREVQLVSGGQVDQCPAPLSWAIEDAIRSGLDAWFDSWQKDF